MLNSNNVTAVCGIFDDTTLHKLAGSIRVGDVGQLMIYLDELVAVSMAGMKGTEYQGQMKHIAVEFEMLLKPVAIHEIKDGWLNSVTIEKWTADRIRQLKDGRLRMICP